VAGKTHKTTALRFSNVRVTRDVTRYYCYCCGNRTGVREHPSIRPTLTAQCHAAQGYKPDGEEGVGWATAKTAGDFGKPVTQKDGLFDGTYAAFALEGFGCMIAGIYRLRFRVSNSKNAGVKGAWARIRRGNHEALQLVNRVRTSSNLDALEPPKA